MAGEERIFETPAEGDERLMAEERSVRVFPDILVWTTWLLLEYGYV